MRLSRLCYFLRHDPTMLYAGSVHMSVIAACDEQQWMDLDICSHISQPSTPRPAGGGPGLPARGLGARGSIGSGVSAC